MTKAASWVATVGACVIALLAGVLNPALAEKPFYEGKTITLSSYGGAGNNYDTYSRLVSRHLGKHIPGHPNIIVMNQPGAGGLVAANYTSRIAPQDGTFITLVSDGLLMFEATGRKGLQDSLTKFKWLAALSSSNVVTATWAGSHIKTIDDARKREVRLGGSGAGAMSSVVPELLTLSPERALRSSKAIAAHPSKILRWSAANSTDAARPRGRPSRISCRMRSGTAS